MPTLVNDFYNDTKVAAQQKLSCRMIKLQIFPFKTTQLYVVFKIE